MQALKHVLFSYTFRPFFLVAALAGAFFASVWVMSLQGIVSLPATITAPYWHGHEMIVGFAMATVAGFTLSAVATWTGRPAVSGLPVFVLAVCWLGGRCAAWFAGVLNTTILVGLDALFPLLLTALLAREVFGARNSRNYKVVAIVFALALFNLAFHLVDARSSLYLLIHTVILLVALIGGRIIPNFTANWLRGQGETVLPANHRYVDRLALGLTMTAGLSSAFWSASPVTGTLAALAALIHLVRISQWRGLQTAGNPLLFILHVAYAWLPVGYALLALSEFGLLIPPTAALHALTMGAIGTMVLAMLTRVPLGHTGRGLKASRVIVVTYFLLTTAVVARILSTLIATAYMPLLNVAGIGWCLSFVLFTLAYWRILTRPPA